jgi:hypothetical protein
MFVELILLYFSKALWHYPEEGIWIWEHPMPCIKAMHSNERDLCDTKLRPPQLKIRKGCGNVSTIWDNSLSVASSVALVSYIMFNLKVDRILIWVIYLLRFTTYYITQLTCIYSKCWKWSPFISVHLSTRFTVFLATFLSVLSFTSSMEIFNNFRNDTFYWRLPSKFFKETLSTVGVRHRF